MKKRPDIRHIVDCLKLLANSDPGKTAFIFLKDGENESARITYKELYTRSLSIAHFLTQQNLIRERVLLLYPDGLDFIQAFFGCLMAGAIAIPGYPPRVHKNLPDRSLPRLKSIFYDARPKFALSTTNVISKLENLYRDAPDFQMVEWFSSEMILKNRDQIKNNQSISLPEINSNDISFLQYTSGSTSEPKGVMVTHENILNNQKEIQKAFNNEKSSVLVSWVPFQHDLGLIGTIMHNIYLGSLCILMPPAAFIQKPVRWLKAITKYKATITAAPNFALELCIQRISEEQLNELNLTTLENMLCCAEPIRHSTVIKFAHRFKKVNFRYSAISPCYGLAEYTLMATSVRHLMKPAYLKVTSEKSDNSDNSDNEGFVVLKKRKNQDSKTLVSCGEVNDSVLIVEPEGRKLLKEREVGEVWLKGGHVAKGYWEKEELSREVFQARLASPTDKSSHLRTGDLGFIHGGHLYIMGRLKDIMIIHGCNYYPQDIEKTVQESSEAIQNDCIAAFSIEKENQENLVVVAELIRHHRGYDLQELCHNIRERIMDEHELRVYSIVFIRAGSLPKTTSGKIQRKSCRELYLEKNLGVIYEDQQGSLRLDLKDFSLKAVRLKDLSVKERTNKIYEALSLMFSKAMEKYPSKMRKERPCEDSVSERPLKNLGLHSIQVAELIGLIQRSLDIEVSFRHFFSDMNLKKFAHFLAKSFEKMRSDDSMAMQKTNRRSEYPVSYGQKLLWLAHQAKGQDASLNLFSALKIKGDVSLRELRDACYGLIERHEILRTTYSLQGDHIFQRVSPSKSAFFFKLRRFSASNLYQRRGQRHEPAPKEEAAESKDFQDMLSKLANTPFDLSKDVPIRFYVFAFSKKEKVILFSAHHIVLDLWSCVILFKEFFSSLNFALVKETPPLRRFNYFDYCVWQNKIYHETGSFSSIRLKKLQRYWLNELNGELPRLDIGSKKKIKHGNWKSSMHFFELETGSSKRLAQFLDQQNIGLFSFLLSVWQLLLHRYSGQSRILVGAPASGRQKAEAQDMVGYFVNPVVFSVDFRGRQDQLFREFLVENQNKVLEVLDHSEYPFTMLLEKLNIQRDPFSSPVFQVFFTLQIPQERPLENFDTIFFGGPASKIIKNAPSAPKELEIASMAIPPQRAQFELALSCIQEVSGALRACIQYRTDLYGSSFIRSMASHYRHLIRSCIRHFHQPISEISIFTRKDIKKLLLYSKKPEKQDTYFLQTGRQKSQELNQEPMHPMELFKAASSRYADQTALIYEQCRLCYSELNEKADRFAYYLEKRLKNKGKNTVVGVCLPKSIDLIVSVLAIWQARCVYLPLDPELPKERLKYMYENSQAEILITHWDVFDERLSDIELFANVSLKNNRELIFLDALQEEIFQPKEMLPSKFSRENYPSLNDSAYVIYTSGSTGRPKGVEALHRSISNLILALKEEYKIKVGDRILQNVSINFDVSIVELLLSLWNGASLVLCHPEELLAGERLFHTLESYRISHLNITPSALALLPKKRLASLRNITVGGESCAPELARFWAKKREFFNVYGLTETTVWASAAKYFGIFDSLSRNIGRPILGAQVFILGLDSGRLMPLGMTGEICIAGECLSRGYLGHMKKTREKFVELDLKEIGLAKRRVYRTGDLGRFLQNGEIEFLSRADAQIKINGVRIEPQEIENVLKDHPLIRNSKVVFSHHKNGNGHLTAYLVLHAKGSDTQLTDQIRSSLFEKLPPVMVPSRFIVLDEFPLNGNHKIDLNSLLGCDQSTSRAYIKPRSYFEKKIAAIWEEVLVLPFQKRVGLKDHFFELGGGSLQAARCAYLVSDKFEVSLSTREIFTNPVLENFVGYILKEKELKPTYVKEVGEAIVPLLRLNKKMYENPAQMKVESASLAYIPDDFRFLSEDANAPEKPFVYNTLQTRWGCIANIILPIYNHEIYIDQSRTIQKILEGLQYAKNLGAGCVSLTGILPSATDYGNLLHEAMTKDAKIYPSFTTGHATTTAAVILNLEKLLKRAGRRFEDQRVGFLGLGSIGLSSLELALEVLGLPRSLILADISSKKNDLIFLAEKLKKRGIFVSVLFCDHKVPDDFYGSDLIIGASNVPNILNVSQLKPGSLIVDDSGPYCFDPQKAIARIKKRKDILITQGGGLNMPCEIKETKYMARELSDSAILSPFLRRRPSEITGCIFSGLMSFVFEDISPTVGHISPKESFKHYSKLEDLSLEAPEPNFYGYEMSKSHVFSFRSLYGQSSLGFMNRVAMRPVSTSVPYD